MRPVAWMVAWMQAAETAAAARQPQHYAGLDGHGIRGGDVDAEERSDLRRRLRHSCWPQRRWTSPRKRSRPAEGLRVWR